MSRSFVALVIALFCAGMVHGQSLKSGDYSELKLAVDKRTNKVTGYFESSTGWDEEAKAPRFSCIFYIEGTATGDQFGIKTYYPGDEAGDMIEGILRLSANGQVSVKLPEEHGGCWNVQHFADKEPATFQLEKEMSWVRISFVTADKAYFYKEKLPTSKLKAYVVKNDIVCIDKIDGEWAHCTFFADRNTTGWVRIKDIH